MLCQQVASCLLIFIALSLNHHVKGVCQWKNDVLPTVEHSIRSDTKNLHLYTDDTAEGYFEIRCREGFRLNPDFGSRVTCLESGQWSDPLPQCISKGSCLISDLFDFIQQANGIQIDQSKSFIITDGVDDTHAIGGANITVDCRDGYENQGGSSLIVCTEGNTWTPFPNCVSTSSDSKSSDSQSSRCPISDDFWEVPNGYLSKADEILIYSDNTATGSAIISCSSGYVVDATSEGKLSCNEGIWSPKPYCTKTGRCSFSQLSDFLHNPKLVRGLKIVSQKLLKDPKENDSILVNSYMNFQCQNGYSLGAGSLTVTCNDDGQWSPFPSCTANK